MKQEITEEQTAFLNKLRLSNKVNMLGAGYYLQPEFGLTRREARDILSQWIINFGEDDDK